jgi:heptosyltransferase I
MSLKLGKTRLIRLDRIGDLVLTLPIDEGLRQLDPHADIRWWIPKGLSFITKLAEPTRAATEVASAFNWRRCKQLLSTLRQDRPDTAIVFHAPWWVGLILFFARVPVRAGPRSQWHQILFFNRAIRQKRSRAELSELEYNFRLTESALGLKAGSIRRHHLNLQAPRADKVLNRFSLTPRAYIVVHPGMGGSALNWPLPMYAQLVTRLTEETRIVVTGTHADEPYLRPIRDMLETNPNVTWLDGQLNGPDLIAVLKNASAVLAPSTGVLHLAASTGVPTIGLFSPVKVQTPKRWAPQGENTRTILPEVSCPGHFKCLGPKCREYDCMQRISVASVRDAISDAIESHSGRLEK